MIHDTKCFGASHTGFISMYCQSVAASLSSLEQNLPAPNSQIFNCKCKNWYFTVPEWMSTVKAGNVYKGRPGRMFSLPVECSNLHDVA